MVYGESKAQKSVQGGAKRDLEAESAANAGSVIVQRDCRQGGNQGVKSGVCASLFVE
jgi:hypothetical protein